MQIIKFSTKRLKFKLKGNKCIIVTFIEQIVYDISKLMPNINLNYSFCQKTKKIIPCYVRI